MHKKRRRPENLQSFSPFLSVFAHDGGTAFICLLVQLVRNPPIQPGGKILLGWISSSLGLLSLPQVCRKVVEPIQNTLPMRN